MIMTKISRICLLQWVRCASHKTALKSVRFQLTSIFSRSQRIAASEAESNFKNMLDATESRERETARERDELRKRNRQVRLAELRGGKFLSWVELDRRNPAANAMST